MGWREEFAGRGFDVPESIIRMEGLKDLSWHNDVCPSFGVEFPDELSLVIWCDHPDPDQRECNVGKRFFVVSYAHADPGSAVLEAAGERAGCVWREDETDDPAEALRVFMERLVKIQAARRSMNPQSTGCASA